MLTLLSKDDIIRVSIFFYERSDKMCKDTQLEQLQARKSNIIKSLEHAVNNGDRLLAEVCERELKTILKQINKIKKQKA